MTAKKDQETKSPEPVEPVALPEPASQPAVEAEAAEVEASKGPKLREYVVTAGAGIAPLGNHRKARAEHGDRARMYKAGEIVHLTAKEARHYIANKSLDPYVPSDED